MELYIANCTRQNFVVHYRLDFLPDGTVDPRRQNQPAKQQTIAAGRQDIIASRDLHMQQIDEIVSQLQKYGMVAVSDVPGLKTTVKKFDPASVKMTPLVFNVGKPVPADVFRTIMDINAGILVGQGRERRARAAVATNATVEHQVAAAAAVAGVDETIPPPPQVNVAFEQLDQSEAGEKRIEEGYKIDKSAPQSAAPRRSTGKKKKS